MCLHLLKRLKHVNDHPKCADYVMTQKFFFPDTQLPDTQFRQKIKCYPHHYNSAVPFIFCIGFLAFRWLRTAIGIILWIAVFLSLTFIGGLSFAAQSGSDNSKMHRVEGLGCFIYGDNDSPSTAKKIALKLAKRNAIENYKAFVSSSSTLKNFVLEDDQVTTLSMGYLYGTKIIDVKEKGREICIKIEAQVNPADVDKLLHDMAQGKHQRAEKAKSKGAKLKGTPITGEWDIFKEKPARSFFIPQADGAVKWTYAVPKFDDNIYAGLNLYIEAVSVQNRYMLISLESAKGSPIWLRLFSVTPGFSKEDDDETWVPTEKLVYLKPGLQDLRLAPSELSVPDWWREEYKGDNAAFYPQTVRIIQFEAFFDEDTGPVDDVIVIKHILLQ